MKKLYTYILILIITNSCITNESDESNINSLLNEKVEEFKKNKIKFNSIKNIVCSVNWKKRNPSEQKTISNHWRRNTDVYKLLSKKMNKLNISSINLDFSLKDTTLDCISFYLNKSEINGVFHYELYLKRVSFEDYSNTRNYSFMKINESTIIVYEN